jgi:nitroreductase
MNQTIETIMKRKGAKSYTKQQVQDSDINTIVSAGIAGPTGRNVQNRHFTVIQNAELLRQINDGVRTLMAAPADYNPLYGAPTLIITSAPVENAPFAEQDCAIAVENMTLAATALGLGSRYLVSPTRFFENENGKAVKKAIGIPEGYRSVACLIVGYDADPSQAPVERNMNVVNYVK